MQVTIVACALSCCLL